MVGYRYGKIQHPKMVIGMAHFIMQMNKYEQQQKFLPPKLLDGEDLPQTRSLTSDHDSHKMAVCSAPPILLDLGTRFYQDFIEEITQSDPELDKFGLVKSFNKKWEDKMHTPVGGYRKLSLQTEEEYHSYSAVHVPTTNYYNSMTPEEQILNSLDQTAQWARDQYGSRAVQSIIESGQLYAKNAIFEALIEESTELTKDKFGNYVFQKIFEQGEPEHQTQLFELIKQKMVEFSQNCYGCRVVQKAIEYTRYRPQLQRQVVTILQPYSLYLIQNINGNHVMQKCIQVIQIHLLTNILQVVSDNYKKLSLHAYGCRVIQKYLEKLNDELNYKEELRIKCLDKEEKGEIVKEIELVGWWERQMFDKLVAMSVELSQCQYGNYVMQHIVSHAKDYQPQIQHIFLNNFEKLSCNKYASNVIERVIKLSAPQYRDALAKRLTDSDSLVTLAKHQFGNYVIQSLMHQISTQSKARLRSKLRESSQEISKSQYGRHVLLQAEKTNKLTSWKTIIIDVEPFCKIYNMSTNSAEQFFTCCSKTSSKENQVVFSNTPKRQISEQHKSRTAGINLSMAKISRQANSKGKRKEKIIRGLSVTMPTQTSTRTLKSREDKEVWSSTSADIERQERIVAFEELKNTDRVVQSRNLHSKHNYSPLVNFECLPDHRMSRQADILREPMDYSRNGGMTETKIKHHHFVKNQQKNIVYFAQSSKHKNTVEFPTTACSKGIGLQTIIQRASVPSCSDSQFDSLSGIPSTAILHGAKGSTFLTPENKKIPHKQGSCIIQPQNSTSATQRLSSNEKQLVRQSLGQNQTNASTMKIINDIDIHGNELKSLIQEQYILKQQASYNKRIYNQKMDELLHQKRQLLCNIASKATRLPQNLKENSSEVQIEEQRNAV